jgi:uncharacterized protein (TIGR03000 family)
MVRRRFSIAGLLALGVLMIAADASQAQLLQRLRSRLGRNSDDGSTTTTNSGRFFSRRSNYQGETVVQGEQTVTGNVPGNQVALDIRVPSSAEVTVNGEKLTATGMNRRFTSTALTAGQTYEYKVKATWTENGKQMSKERTVSAQPGQRTTVDLMAPANGKKMPPQAEPIKQPKDSE